MLRDCCAIAVRLQWGSYEETTPPPPKGGGVFLLFLALACVIAYHVAMDATQKNVQQEQIALAVGAKVFAGFPFTYMGEEDYTRRDGKQTQVRVWQGKCRRCRQLFSVITPMYVTGPESSNHLNVRRCKACRPRVGERKSTI